MALMDRFDLDSLQGLEISKLRNSSICILGGTGFIGTWLVSTLNQLNRLHGLNIDITIYTRNKVKALNKFAKGNCDRLTIREFDFLHGTCTLGVFDFIINGATPTSSKPGFNTKDIFFHPTMNAVHSIIGTAKLVQNSPRVLNLSSGAVYGHQPLEVSNQLERKANFLDQADDYQQAKYSSELALSSPEALQVLLPISPRLFAFYGPGLPLDKHFAIGNFVRDGLSGGPIRVQGSPDTRRSYMFPTDLVVWLLKSVIDPKIENVNIGSEISMTMLDLASMISQLTSKKGVTLINPSTPASNYVPSTEVFRSIYGVNETIGLENGIKLWLEWLLNQ
jgi:dTDP-glucose 4,6-dehydratase